MDRISRLRCFFHTFKNGSVKMWRERPPINWEGISEVLAGILLLAIIIGSAFAGIVISRHYEYLRNPLPPAVPPAGQVCGADLLSSTPIEGQCSKP
jgi:hypothetical protein